MIDDPTKTLTAENGADDPPAGALPALEQVQVETANASNFDAMLTKMESQIGYRFRNRDLLRRALTHRSFANEQPDPRPLHNEALEFLGDAVLEFLISSWLLETHPDQTEGTLSKMRAYAVSAINLQKHAARLGIGNYLLLNRGEEKTGGRGKMALQVDAYEALIAAIYLDGGIDRSREFVLREFATTFAEIDPRNLTSTDYKTALQEKLQSNGLPAPQYAIVERLGPDHRRVFQIELRVNGYCLATGEGTTIKSAHQAAARAAVMKIDEDMASLREIREQAGKEPPGGEGPSSPGENLASEIPGCSG